MKKLLILLGAIALTFTLATAEEKCGKTQQGMMENNSKCGDSQKGMKQTKEKRETYQKGMMDKNDGRCGADLEKKKETKPAPAKGKCGTGKCGD